MTPSEAAQMLRLHEKTILRWCHRALAGAKSRLDRAAIRHCPLTGFYYIRERAVRDLHALVLAERTRRKEGTVGTVGASKRLRLA